MPSRGTSGPIAATVLHDPAALTAALGRGDVDAVVFGDADRAGVEAALAAARAADVALVLTDPDGTGPTTATSRTSPSRSALAATVRARARRRAGPPRRPPRPAAADRPAAARRPPRGRPAAGGRCCARRSAARRAVRRRRRDRLGAAADRGELRARARAGDVRRRRDVRSPDEHLAGRAALARATVADGPHVAVPLVAGGTCEGVLELHLAPGARPDARLVADVAALASQVALHLRYRRGAAMLDLHERALAATNNGIVIADADPDGERLAGRPTSTRRSSSSPATAPRRSSAARSRCCRARRPTPSRSPRWRPRCATARSAGSRCATTAATARPSGTRSS